MSFTRFWLETAAWLIAIVAAIAPINTRAEDARFVKAINLNGPPLIIDGHQWLGSKNSPDFTASGQHFENQQVPLRPATDPPRASMLRSSTWGRDAVLEFSNLPEGPHQIVLWLWEDNQSERCRFSLNGRTVLDNFSTGTAGSWHRLGPWPCRPNQGHIRLTADGGAANFSGIELWAGDGPIPPPDPSGGFNLHPSPEQLAFFENRIRPLLIGSCFNCHSASAKTLRGGLLLDSRAGILRGGDHGPVIIPGHPDQSPLIIAVRRQQPDFAMPPDHPLEPSEIADLASWITMGAPDPRTDDTVALTRERSAAALRAAADWWSLKPLTDPSPPAVRDSSWPRHDLDRFILARLEAANLSPATDADRRTLIRRASYTLTGLPPSPDDVAAFLADSSPDAFASVVDRLLASPQYGERWGRHWLDVVRYADTAGDNSDFPVPQAYRYRDWVIAAVNKDLPYPEFVRLQLAGDLVPVTKPAERAAAITATGYLAISRRFGSRVDDYPWHLTIEDTIDNLGRAFLGTSISCARCHDHKFDPISTQDYYALYGIFQSTRYPWPGIELEQKQRDFIPIVSGKIRDPLRDTAYAVTDAPEPRSANVQKKGNPDQPGESVPRRFLSVLGGHQLAPDNPTSGRLALADWIFQPSNPLPARVFVNRVWLHHFGTGIVPTPNDFGRQGQPPSHPDLLDWLAARFISDGWQLKPLHRRILLSRTWQQASTRSAAATETDPLNSLLSSFPRQRLDAESLRDTLLLLGRSLKPGSPGPHPFPPPKDWKFTQHNPFKAIYDSDHRTVYLMTPRIQKHPFLSVFDGPDAAASTGQRLTSTTPLQSLFLLNDPLVHRQAERLAASLTRDLPDNPSRITSLFSQLFTRPPTTDESREAAAFLEQARATGAEPWPALVRALLQTNEFIWLD